MSKLYLTISTEDNNRYFAYVMEVPKGADLVMKLDDRRIVEAKPWHTRRKAQQYADALNQHYQEESVNLYEV